MGISGRSLAFRTIALRMGAPFGALGWLWSGNPSMGALAGTFFGLLMAWYETGRLSHRDFSKTAWRDRTRVWREGVFTIPLALPAARVQCRDGLRRRLGASPRCIEPDHLEFRIPWNFEDPRVYVRVRLLPGPDDSTHLCYRIRPRFGYLGAAPSLRAETALREFATSVIAA